MVDKIQGLEFNHLLNWICNEFKNHHSIFGIAYKKFFFKKDFNAKRIFNTAIETPIGSAAGPHTVFVQNIISSYLTGGRFFELNTIHPITETGKFQRYSYSVDDFRIGCLNNLSIEQSYKEYIKAWFLIHFLNKVFHFSPIEEKAFVFNMNLSGSLIDIKSQKIDLFLNHMIDASLSSFFNDIREYFLGKLKDGSIKDMIINGFGIEHMIDDETELCIECFENLPTQISNSVTLSVLPHSSPDEIATIVKYLINEKGLHTYLRLDPILLGNEFIVDTLGSLGYKHIEPVNNIRNHNLQDILSILPGLNEYAKENDKEFGVTLTSSLEIKPSYNFDRTFLSGYALFPLVANLAYILSEEFDGQLNISLSGGVSIHNIKDVLSAGIFPITLSDDLIRPGGYNRILQIAEAINNGYKNQRILKSKSGLQTEIDLNKLKILAETSLNDSYYFYEYKRCKAVKTLGQLPAFDCFTQPCKEACPIHQDISSYIRLIEEERPDDAFELFISENPLPHITSYICERPCTSKCVRWNYDSPLLIRDLEKLIVTKGYNRFINNVDHGKSQVKNKPSVAIIGTNPSGLSAAYYLNRAGCQVTVFEKSNIGIQINQLIPHFRLPQFAIDNDIELLKQSGINFHLEDVNYPSVEELKPNGFNYTLIANRSVKPKELILEGDKDKVYTVIDFMKRLKCDEIINLGHVVAVIGGGNTAVDCARSALKYKGVDTVYLLYRRTKECMTADSEEFNLAIKEGIIFKELLLPVEYNGNKLKCRIMKLDETNINERKNAVPVEEQFYELEVDSIISAIGTMPFEEELKHSNITDHIIDNVYTFPFSSSFIQSVSDGKVLAEKIITKEKLRHVESEKIICDKEKLNDDLISRKGIIHQQEKDNLLLEASRCMNCNINCNLCIEVCPNRANVAIEFSALEYKNINQIIHIDSLCTECGNCGNFCPYNGSPSKDKFTLYREEKSFINCNNNGLVLIRSKSENFLHFKIRIDSIVYDFELDFKSNIISWSPNIQDQQRFNFYTNMIKDIYRNYSYLLMPPRDLF